MNPELHAFFLDPNASAHLMHAELSEAYARACEQAGPQHELIAYTDEFDFLVDEVRELLRDENENPEYPEYSGRLADFGNALRAIDRRRAEVNDLAIQVNQHLNEIRTLLTDAYLRPGQPIDDYRYESWIEARDRTLVEIETLRSTAEFVPHIDHVLTNLDELANAIPHDISLSDLPYFTTPVAPTLIDIFLDPSSFPDERHLEISARFAALHSQIDGEFDLLRYADGFRDFLDYVRTIESQSQQTQPDHPYTAQITRLWAAVYATFHRSTRVYSLNELAAYELRNLQDMEEAAVRDNLPLAESPSYEGWLTDTRAIIDTAARYSTFPLLQPHIDRLLTKLPELANTATSSSLAEYARIHATTPGTPTDTSTDERNRPVLSPESPSLAARTTERSEETGREEKDTQSASRTYDPDAACVFRFSRDEWGVFSNFYPSILAIDAAGHTFKTSEHLYQAAKFRGSPTVQARIASASSARDAATMGRDTANKPDADWNARRIDAMRWVIRMKREANPELVNAALQKTGDRPIVEYSRHDSFWGAQRQGDSLVGQNVLGRLWMELRHHVRTADPRALAAAWDNPLVPKTMARASAESAAEADLSKAAARATTTLDRTETATAAVPANERPLVWAGIGSRGYGKEKMPPSMIPQMTELARRMAAAGWHLSSGGADGSDTAFANGTPVDQRTIWLPWPGYNDLSGPDCQTIPRDRLQQSMEIAKTVHPAWHKCKPGHRKLHARNGHILLGRDLDRPVDAVVAYTHRGELQGGTAQGLRIAMQQGIPIFNLGSMSMEQAWEGLQALQRSLRADTTDQSAKAGRNEEAAHSASRTQGPDNGPSAPRRLATRRQYREAAENSWARNHENPIAAATAWRQIKTDYASLYKASGERLHHLPYQKGFTEFRHLVAGALRDGACPPEHRDRLQALHETLETHGNRSAAAAQAASRLEDACARLADLKEKMASEPGHTIETMPGYTAWLRDRDEALARWRELADDHPLREPHREHLQIVAPDMMAPQLAALSDATLASIHRPSANYAIPSSGQDVYTPSLQPLSHVYESALAFVDRDPRLLPYAPQFDELKAAISTAINDCSHAPDIVTMLDTMRTSMDQNQQRKTRAETATENVTTATHALCRMKSQAERAGSPLHDAPQFKSWREDADRALHEYEAARADPDMAPHLARADSLSVVTDTALPMLRDARFRAPVVTASSIAASRQRSEAADEGYSMSA